MPINKSLIELERDIYFSLENGDTFENVLENICHTVDMTIGKKCHCSIVLIDENQKMVNIFGNLTKELKKLDEQVFLMSIKQKRY